MSQVPASNDPKDTFFINLDLRFRKVFGREMTEQERHFFTLAEKETQRTEKQRRNGGGIAACSPAAD